MQSPFSAVGSEVHPKLSILKGLFALSHIQVPFKYLPWTAMTSGSFTSTKITIVGLNFHTCTQSVYIVRDFEFSSALAHKLNVTKSPKIFTLLDLSAHQALASVMLIYKILSN
jgi:hypothetical protein